MLIFAGDRGVFSWSADRSQICGTTRQEVPFWSVRGHNLPCRMVSVRHGYWSKISCWTAEEFAAISLGWDPSEIDENVLQAMPTSVAKEFKERLRLVERAILMNELNKHSPPAMMLRWGRSMGVSIPKELERLLDERNGTGTPERAVLPKERQSYLKLILGLAHWRFGPRIVKSPGNFHSKIQSHLSTVGLPMDVDTIRKHLCHAVSEYGDRIE